MWRKTENRSDPTQDLKVNWHAEHIYIETYFNEKTPIGSVCTVATEMKTSAKRQKVNAVNK